MCVCICVMWGSGDHASSPPWVGVEAIVKVRGRYYNYHFRQLNQNYPLILPIKLCFIVATTRRTYDRYPHINAFLKTNKNLD